MSGKSGKSGKKKQSRQEQQAAAARRHIPARTIAMARIPHVPQPPPPSASPANRRYYLDVSAVRIQQWLGRTPTLKLRRGASVMLSEATGRAAWPDANLPPGMSWNEEAGDLDGVVSLVLAQEQAQEQEQALEQAMATLCNAAREIAGKLRGQLLHCPVQAVFGAGGSYAEAYEEIERARRDGVFLIDAPAPPAEAILAKPCDDCRSAPAVERDLVIAPREKRDLCAECKARLDAAGRTASNRPEDVPRPERRMREALEHSGIAVTGFPDNFEQLKEAGRTASGDKPTQLALIYADGNRVGEFLGAAARLAATEGKPVKADIVRTIDNATLGALADAIRTCFPASDRPAVLAHVAGGDDLVVSVPARFAWPFVTALLSAFGHQVDAATGKWPAPVRELLPSMSAGLVFHHWKYPLADVIRLAKDQLGQAKRATRGRAASAAFLDLTADGEHPPAGREPHTLAKLDQRAALIASVASIAPSQRQTMLAYLREGDTGTFARRVVDLGYQPLLRAVSEDLDAVQIRAALDLARWWPPDHADVRQEVPA